MKPKSIFKSKTFWLNVLGGVLMYGEYLPPKIAGPAVAIANIINRFLTVSPVNVMGSEGE